jgi:addiction module HigA family antidote
MATTGSAFRRHPGETLLEGFMLPLNLSTQRLAAELEMSNFCLDDIVHGRARITSDTALRLAQYFDTSANFWTNLQERYDAAAGRP